MAISIGMISDMLMSPIMWLMIIFAVFLAGIGGLWLRKQKKLEYKCLIIAPAGNEKTSIKLTKAGWFKSKFFMKLWDYGNEEVIKTSDGRKIYGVTRSDMHFFKGDRCIVCWEKGDDRKVLVPINSLTLGKSTEALLAEIAPVDLRDVSSQILRDTDAELKGSFEKYMIPILIGGTIIFALVSIIMVVQMVKNGQTEAGNLILKAGEIVAGAGSGGTVAVSP